MQKFLIIIIVIAILAVGFSFYQRENQRENQEITPMNSEEMFEKGPNTTTQSMESGLGDMDTWKEQAEGE